MSSETESKTVRSGRKKRRKGIYMKTVWEIEEDNEKGEKTKRVYIEPVQG